MGSVMIFGKVLIVFPRTVELYAASTGEQEKKMASTRSVSATASDACHAASATMINLSLRGPMVTSSPPRRVGGAPAFERRTNCWLTHWTECRARLLAECPPLPQRDVMVLCYVSSQETTGVHKHKTLPSRGWKCLRYFSCSTFS